MHFDAVLSEFIHPCSTKRRRAQYSRGVDTAVCARALQMCVCVRALQICARALQMCARALQMCARALQMCARALQMCARALQMCALQMCALQMCARALQMSVRALQMSVRALQMCARALQMCARALQMCARALQMCARALQMCARALQMSVRALQMCVQCVENFSHSARLQQSRAFYMLALCLRAVLISSPDTWDWRRMHALMVMHRRTLYENVDSAKIKVCFYTTDIDILSVALMHRIVIHCIDESLHPYWWHMDYFTDVIIMCLCLDRSNTLAVYAGSENQKYLKLCSEDERRSGFGTTSGRGINDNFNFWVNYPFKKLNNVNKWQLTVKQ